MQNIDFSKIYDMETSPHSIRLPNDLMDEIRLEAKKEGRTIGKYLTAIIADHLTKIKGDTL